MRVCGSGGNSLVDFPAWNPPPLPSPARNENGDGRPGAHAHANTHAPPTPITLSTANSAARTYVADGPAEGVVHIG
ncbi:hypothetical protein CVT25_001200 [Psilocybe cyanescens]|uniref:Uncharacterized protein n=1 Tax=Psilocybe cyanescens TaxID=93625 RepID=A0A409XAY5_PSICY|nr:hypothetical protein CVT25_001200 [Psilocybe cyanescens]